MMQVYDVKEQMQLVEKNPEKQEVLHVQDRNFLSMMEGREWSLCPFSSICRKRKIAFRGTIHTKVKSKSEISPHIVR